MKPINSAIRPRKQDISQSEKMERLRLIEDAITRLQSQFADPWVKIEDIPDEWKDGVTEVDLYVTYFDESGKHRLTDCKFNCKHDEWETPDYYLSDFAVYPTHAMLPVAPPKGSNQ